MRHTHSDPVFNFSTSELPPPALKYLLIALGTVSLTMALLHPVWNVFTTLTSPAAFLSLSAWGISNFYLWQPLTYQFLLDTLSGVSFWSLIGLAFNLYFTYWLGLQLISRITTKGFLALYLMNGAMSGLLAIGMAALLGQHLFLSGPSASILGCFVLWCLLNPHQELYFFFVIRLTAQQLLYTILGVMGLVNLSRGDLASIILYGTSALIAYGVYRYLNNPYGFSFFETHISEKIIPFPSYSIETESDEEFVDRMLEKISKYGEKSLSSREAAKLNSISKEKK